jgi:cob(I)alamin adenosyltransferase
MGHIYLYYGTGGGKTTSALGLALRSVGHKHRVIVIQIMKWFTETGEIMVADLLSPYYEIRQFGRRGWLKIGIENTKNVTGIETRYPTEEDIQAAHEGLDYAEKALINGDYDLLILDEVCLAIHIGLLTVEEVLKILENIPKRTNVILTGRYAPKELVERADFVNQIVEIKAPDGFVTEKGIQY